MKRLTAIIVILVVLLACRLPPPDETPTPTALQVAPRLPTPLTLLDIEEAVGFASITDLLIAGLPANAYQNAKKEYLSADYTLISNLNQAGFSLLVSNNQVNLVLGEGNARLCIMPYPRSIPLLNNPRSTDSRPFIGHSNGQAVFGVGNDVPGLDGKDTPEVTLIEAVPLENLPTELRCALVRANQDNPLFESGTLRVLLINITNREIAGSMPAAFSPAAKTTLRWNAPQSRAELVSLDSVGKYVKNLFTLKGCYFSPSPTITPSRLVALTPKPQPTVGAGTPTPLTKDGKFDFLADFSRWPRITSQAQLAAYVSYVKNNLVQTWNKAVCNFPIVAFDQPERKQLIYFDYPVCICGQETPYKKIAGFIIEVTGRNTMYGIISQVWTPTGNAFVTALGDLFGSRLVDATARALLTNGDSYMSIYGDYLKTPGKDMPHPTLIESPIIFMLDYGWIKMDEYNAAFKEWSKTGFPPKYFEDHPGTGEITQFFIQWQH